MAGSIMAAALELWRELYEPFNLMPFAGGSTGVQMAGWFNREINSMEDIKGLKMRIPRVGRRCDYPRWWDLCHHAGG